MSELTEFCLWHRIAPGDGNIVTWVLRVEKRMNTEFWFFRDGEVVSQPARIDWDRHPGWERAS